jgi:rRNA maturation endonuclease Nob1
MSDERKGKVIEIPPERDLCPSCGGRLRPAKRNEIEADLRNPDPQIRQLAEWSAQGDRDWTPPEHFSEWDKDSAIRERPSWQFRCDRCGHRSVIAREKGKE